MGWVAVWVLITAGAGLWRIIRGPLNADRILGVQVITTSGIAALLVLAAWYQQPVWRDVALLLALLGAVVTVALVQLLREPGSSGRGKSS